MRTRDLPKGRRPPMERVLPKAQTRPTPRTRLILQPLLLRSFSMCAMSSSRIHCGRDAAPLSSSDPFRAPKLSLERLTVRADRVVCDVLLAPGSPRMTSPALMACVCQAYPNLPRHTCVNDAGDTFADVMNRTSIPHLLEHLVIDEQVRSASSQASSNASADVGPVFVGTTEWTDEFEGRARIEVSFTDDLVALRAFRDAARFLNETVVP